MGHLKRLCPQRKVECTQCRGNPFKLFPNCDKHEPTRQEIVLMFDDRETLDALNVLVWDLEHLAEEVIADMGYQSRIIEGLKAKIPEKQRKASERNRRSIIGQSRKIANTTNARAVEIIRARDRLSELTKQWIEKQKEQRKRVKWKNPKKKKRKTEKKGPSNFWE